MRLFSVANKSELVMFIVASDANRALEIAVVFKHIKSVKGKKAIDVTESWVKDHDYGYMDVEIPLKKMLNDGMEGKCSVRISGEILLDYHIKEDNTTIICPDPKFDAFMKDFRNILAQV